jgi:hypothetical protein
LAIQPGRASRPPATNMAPAPAIHPAVAHLCLDGDTLRFVAWRERQKTARGQSSSSDDAGARCSSSGVRKMRGAGRGRPAGPEGWAARARRSNGSTGAARPPAPGLGRAGHKAQRQSRAVRRRVGPPPARVGAPSPSYHLHRPVQSVRDLVRWVGSARRELMPGSMLLRLLGMSIPPGSDSVSIPVLPAVRLTRHRPSHRVLHQKPCLGRVRRYVTRR